ncbi:uncharacterized protein LOC119373962 [Rhipicephalus sanguineus]|nr:uncharacterized protein LOC119373962 [Rhipicephalus sanguineus]
MVAPFITVLMLVAVGTATAVPPPYVSTGDCDFSTLNLDAMVNDIIIKMPSEYSTKSSKPEEVVPGLFVGPIVFKGMDKLRPFGAALGFCRNGTSLVQVDLATTAGMLEAVIPWKTCAGQKGTIETYTGARVTFIFEVAPPSGEEESYDAGARLVYHSGPIPVYMDDVFVALNGAGQFLRTAVGVLSKLLPQLPKEFWVDAIGDKLRSVIQEVARRA